MAGGISGGGGPGGNGAFASLVPMQQFDIITALTIIYSLVAADLIEPVCLKLWADRRWSGPTILTESDRAPALAVAGTERA